MRYFMRLSYLGEGYLGWQVQPQGVTVQGSIEAAMQMLLGQEIRVTGAGRTDTGVNARMMIAHFDADPDHPQLKSLKDFAYKLSAILGRNIAIYEIWPVASDAHARFDAKERTYRYYTVLDKSPFLWQLSWKASPGLDFAAMNAAAKHLIGKKDFTSFSKLHTQVKTNICDIRKAEWKEEEGLPGLWYFEITADRFLRNMVRAIVGTLVEIGRGKMAPDDMIDIIAQKNRACAGTSMPPYALYLWDIKY